ncbi:MAG TPA: hypothetical protein VIV66_23145 [Pyrinomonadaceae bacterium]
MRLTQRSQAIIDRTDSSDIHAVKFILQTSIRIIALTILYFGCFVVISGALLSVPQQTTTVQANAVLFALLVVGLINTAVLAYITLRSHWAGWKLMLTIFVLFYGVVTVMSQIESAFFITRLPPGMLSRLFLAGAIMAAVFAPLVVLILGKGKSPSREAVGQSRLQMTAGSWAIKLSVIVVAYVLIYFTFGYYIAWRNAAVRSYYSGIDPGSFVGQITSVLRDRPTLFPLQVVRALMWTALAVPVIKMMKGAWWEAGLAVALLFGVLMNTQLFLPNPFMPHEVRMAHLLETAPSNFLFGWLVVLVLLAGTSELALSKTRSMK